MIGRRLEAIEDAKWLALFCHYASDYPDADVNEASRLATLVASSRMRVLAESALRALPLDRAEEILREFER